MGKGGGSFNSAFMTSAVRCRNYKKQETQLSLTKSVTRLEVTVTQGHQTWYHSIC